VKGSRRSVKSPLSLRALLPVSGSSLADNASAVTALGVAALLSTTALAQEPTTALPPVKVDAPREKPRPVVVPVKPKAAPVVVAKPQPVVHHAPAQSHTASAQSRAGSSSSQAAAAAGRGGQSTSAAAVSGSADSSQNVPLFIQAQRDPYADPAAPYRAIRLASNKFTQPILNTPRTVTVLTREALDDKNAWSLREIGRSTAGVTLGTGEGGNAFGDRFFIRGFDARNDIFIDGVRDPGVSVRETFYTEQVEILRGPGSTFAGRGTTGGAINIVTKQANFISDFTDLRTTGGFTDGMKRVTLDVNKVVSPILAIRANGMFQNAGVAGRDFVTDNRNGASGSVVFKPLDKLTLTAQYTHVYLNGLPDFGVPYNRTFNRPFPEGITQRFSWYGLANRDRGAYSQDFGTFVAEYRYSENVKFTNRFRQETSVIDYIGTLAQGGNLIAGTVQLSPQSRYQVTNVLDNQTEANIDFNTGPIKHQGVVGVEFSREGLQRTSYAGLASELNGPAAAAATRITCNIYLPCNLLPFTGNPYRLPNYTNLGVNTSSGYLIETANWQDTVLVNGGLRFDDYNIWNRDTIGTVAAQSHSFMTNYNAGLVLKPLKDVSLYAAYATSTNPVGAELDGSAANYGGLSTAVQIFPPQYNRAKEIGVKWQAFEHLLATAALFRTDVQNAREVNSGVTTGNSAYFVQGVDLELAGNFTERWSVVGGLVVMESKVTNSFAWSNVGLSLANIANESFSMLSKYKFGDLIGLGLDGLEVGGQAIYRSKVYGGNNLVANGGTNINIAGWPAPNAANPFVNVPTALPSYWRFDVFAEMNLSKNVGLKFSVQNLFDRTIYDAFYQTAAPFTQIAPGRAAYLEAKVTF
jgi:catecholate siderophore receptor